MFLPIGDDNKDRKITPVVNYLLIAANIIAFIFWQHWGTDANITMAYSAVPGEILTGKDIVTESLSELNRTTGNVDVYPGLQPTPIPVFLTLITSMFMHGGIAHIAGNMLYLFIFGDNIEDALGHFKYLLFYLLTGVIAGLSHVFTSAFLGQNLLIPSLGASGAISAVLGGYLMLYPGRGVHLWIFITVISVPAIISVGLWFVFQVMNGLGTLGGDEMGGIAYAAHIGGFIAGFLLIRIFAKPFLEARRKSRMRM